MEFIRYTVCVCVCVCVFVFVCVCVCRLYLAENFRSPAMFREEGVYALDKTDNTYKL